MRIVVAYRGIPHARGWATGDNLVRAFRRLGHDVYAYGNYYETAERIEQGPSPPSADLLVYCEMNDDEPQYEELGGYPAALTAYWDFDADNGRRRERKRLIRRLGCDVVFYANPRYARFFGALAPHTAFLPYAVDDEHFVRLAGPKTIDVGLIGSPYPERVAYLEELAKLGAPVEIVDGMYREQLVEAINALKIHLNLNIDARGGSGLLVGRIWETIGCGTLLLTQQKDYVERILVDGEHAVFFEDLDDCAEKIAYYLAHDAERERIAAAGHRYGLDHHTYVARAQTILAEIGDLPPRRRRRLPRLLYRG
jgi:hypothetical protein